MEVTDVRIRKVTEESKMKAIVSVTFDDEFVVHDIKVIDGINGLFVAMPSRKMADGEFRDIAHPINATTRRKIHEAVFKEYEKSLEKIEENQEGAEIETSLKEKEELSEEAAEKI
nr:septation regulator SpoVG [Tissierella sp.]